MQFTVVSSGTQPLFNGFRSKNEFILEKSKVGHLKKKRLSCGK